MEVDPISSVAKPWADKFGADARTVGAYLLALGNAPSYSEAFFEAMESEMVRFPPTLDPDLFTEGVQLGEILFKAWSLEASPRGVWHQVSTGTRLGEASIEGTTIHFENGDRLEGIHPETWKFEVSGYPVMERLLEGRAHLALSVDIAESIRRVAGSIATILESRALRRHERHGRPIQPQTVLGYWQVGKGFVTFLRAEGAFEGENPFDLFGKPRVPAKSMWAPSRDECIALLRVPDRKTVQGLRDLSLLYILLDTGLRVSAVTQIRLRDIDVSERKIWVTEKGRRERVVPFGVQTLRWLRRCIAAARLGLDDPLFPGRNGRPMTRKRVDEIIKSCARQASIRRGSMSAHDLRRAFAREFLRNGGDMESLRQLLGHTSYAMVKRYAELASDVVAEKHRKSSPGDHLVV